VEWKVKSIPEAQNPVKRDALEAFSDKSGKIRERE